MPMDPVTQTLAQQTSGSAGGEGFGQFFVQGRQQALQSRQLNLSQRRLELEQSQEKRLAEASKMLLPLQVEQLRMSNINAGIAATTNIQKLYAQQQSNTVAPQIYSLETRFMQSPLGYNDPALLQELTDLQQQYPFAFAEGAGAKLRMGVKGTLMYKKEMLDYLKFDKELQAQGLRLTGSQFNPETGRRDFSTQPIKSPTVAIPDKIEIATELSRLQSILDNPSTPLAERSAARSQYDNLQKQIEPSNRGTADMQNQDYADDLRKAIDALPVDSPSRSRLEGTLKEFLTRTAPSKRVIRSTPEGGFEMIEGATDADVAKQPASVVARSEETAVNALNVANVGVELIKLASDPKNVGALGNFRRLASEVGGQFGNVSNDSAFDYATHAAQFRAAVFPMLKSDSQITQTELNQIMSDLPSKGFQESDESAVKKARGAIKAVVESAKRRIARTPGVKMPAQFLTSKDKLILRKLVENGQITQEEAVEALKRDDPLF